MDEWATPQTFVDYLMPFYHFTLDPCATVENKKCANFYTKEDDGLAGYWSGVAFVNPPYGKHGEKIGDWVAKAWCERHTCTSILLLPVRADTEWWQQIPLANRVTFMRNRLYFSFDGKSLRAPFATCLWEIGEPQRDTEIRVMGLLSKQVRGHGSVGR